MTHELKILPEYFKAVAEGKKTFEIRRDDRGIKVGDLIVLKEFDAEKRLPTGRWLSAEVTYILRNVPQYGLDTEYCVFSFAVRW